MAAARARLYTIAVEVDGERYYLSLPAPTGKDQHTTVLWDPDRETMELAHADPPDWSEPPPGAVALGRIILPRIREGAG